MYLSARGGEELKPRACSSLFLFVPALLLNVHYFFTAIVVAGRKLDLSEHQSQMELLCKCEAKCPKLHPQSLLETDG